MTLPAVIFPDTELVMTAYLRAALAPRSEPYAQTVYVANAVPSTRRDRMVTFRRDGGPRLDVVREAARLAVNVWGRTEQEASDLARLVAALIWAAPDGQPVCKVTQVGGASPVPDVQPRRSMTFELIVKGSDLT